jgi:hypothetical protein
MKVHSDYFEVYLFQYTLLLLFRDEVGDVEHLRRQIRNLLSLQQLWCGLVGHDQYLCPSLSIFWTFTGEAAVL